MSPNALEVLKILKNFWLHLNVIESVKWPLCHVILHKKKFNNKSELTDLQRNDLCIPCTNQLVISSMAHTTHTRVLDLKMVQAHHSLYAARNRRAVCEECANVVSSIECPNAMSHGIGHWKSD